MKPSTFLTVLLPIIFLISLVRAATGTVEWEGTMKAVHHGDVSGKVPLQRFSGRKHLYALGPVAELDGEVTIIDGTAHIAQVRNGEIKTSNSYAISASFLVWAEVSAWRTPIPLGKNAENLSQLEVLIEALGREHGLDLSSPFPFILDGSFDLADFHVLSAPPTPASGVNHRDSAKNFSIKQTKGKIIGFFSTHHEGVFTHHGSATHLHILLENGLSGHVDALAVNSETKIHFPE